MSRECWNKGPIIYDAIFLPLLFPGRSRHKLDNNVSKQKGRQKIVSLRRQKKITVSLSLSLFKCCPLRVVTFTHHDTSSEAEKQNVSGFSGSCCYLAFMLCRQVKCCRRCVLSTTASTATARQRERTRTLRRNKGISWYSSSNSFAPLHSFPYSLSLSHAHWSGHWHERVRRETRAQMGPESQWPVWHQNNDCAISAEAFMKREFLSFPPLAPSSCMPLALSCHLRDEWVKSM